MSDLTTFAVWDNFEFYNMTGVHFFFNDDSMEEICHMQAWTLGLGETVRSFCSKDCGLSLNS